MRSRWHLQATAVVALALTGCLGGQSTDDGGRCDSTSTPLETDSTPSPRLGLSAEQVLSVVPRSVVLNARWTPPAGMTLSAGDSAVDVTLEIERTRAQAAEVESCEGTSVAVPVTARIATSDGALDESLPGALFASRPHFTTLKVEFPFEALRGTLAIDTNDPATRLVQPYLVAPFTEGGGSGALAAVIERRLPGAVSSPGNAMLLRWPADHACNPERAQRPLNGDERWRSGAEDARAGTWAGEWSDHAGESVGVAVDVAFAGALCESEDGTVDAPASIRLETSEGRLGITLPSNLVDGGSRLELPGDRSFGGAPRDFVARHGDLGLGLSTFAHVELEMEIVPRSGAGRFAVIGYTDTCAPCPDGACSCGPMERSVVAELRLQRTAGPH